MVRSFTNIYGAIKCVSSKQLPVEEVNELFSYACSEDERLVLALLENYEPDYRSADSNGQTPLLLLLRNGMEKAALKVLSMPYSNFDQASLAGQTPLLVSTFYGYDKVTEKLIELGAKATASNDGRTPLINAAMNGNRKIYNAIFQNCIEDSSVLKSAALDGLTAEDWIALSN